MVHSDTYPIVIVVNLKWQISCESHAPVKLFSLPPPSVACQNLGAGTWRGLYHSQEQHYHSYNKILKAKIKTMPQKNQLKKTIFSIHVQLSYDGHTRFELRSESIGRTLSQTQQSNQNVCNEICNTVMWSISYTQCSSKNNWIHLVQDLHKIEMSPNHH